MALHLPAVFVFVWLYAGDGSREFCRGSGLPQVGTATSTVELRSQPMGGGWPACPQGLVYFEQQQPGASPDDGLSSGDRGYCRDENGTGINKGADRFEKLSVRGVATSRKVGKSDNFAEYGTEIMQDIRRCAVRAVARRVRRRERPESVGCLLVRQPGGLRRSGLLCRKRRGTERRGVDRDGGAESLFRHDGAGER